MEYYISHIFNFLLVVGILFKVGRKPAVDFVKSRSKGIEKDMSEAEEAYRIASEKENKWQSNWKSVQGHKDQLMADAKNSAQHFSETTLSSAKTQAERIESDTKRLAQSELLRAKRSVQQNIVEKSLAMAKQFMDQSLGKSERKKLIADSLEKVGSRAS